MTQQEIGMADNPWEDLVVSVLSVNNFPLERTYVFLENLRAQGLFDPENLVLWSITQIEARLRAAGFDRGAFMTNLFAQRLRHLGALIDQRGADVCFRVISGRDTTAIESLLLPVKGVGPRVIANLIALRGLDGRKSS